MQNQLKKRRFTLIEMMVAMGVFMILLTLLLNFFSGTRQVWKTLRDRNDSFEKARVAMDIVTDLLTTSVADEGNVGFWVPTTNDSCTFVTRTTRNLSSAAASGDDLSKELDNYYLAKIYAENGVLKLVGQRMGNSFTVSLDNTTAPVPAGTAKNIIDAVLVNNSLPENISEGYAKTGSIPVRLDMENITPIGIEVVSQKLIQENRQGLVRHSSNRVARAVYYWYRKSLKK